MTCANHPGLQILLAARVRFKGLIAGLPWVNPITSDGSFSFGEQSARRITFNEECLHWCIWLESHLVDVGVAEEMIHSHETLLTTRS